jgi:hypothetical protein
MQWTIRYGTLLGALAVTACGTFGITDNRALEQRPTTKAVQRVDDKIERPEPPEPDKEPEKEPEKEAPPLDRGPPPPPPPPR